MYNDEISDLEELDSTWIYDFDKTDNEYKMYYTEDLSFIKIRSIYINADNEIEKVKEEQLFFKESNTIQKEELLSVIKHNSFLNDNRYRLMLLLKVNINIQPQELKNFLRSKSITIGEQFIRNISSLDSIKFEKTISMFHDLNELIVLFKVRNDKSHKPYSKKSFRNTNKKTRKINLKQ